MTLTQFPRPCPIPGHPQDAEPGPLESESAWTRLRAWHLHAPAERLPLPLALLLWPSAWVLHAVHVPGHVVTWAAAGAVLITWTAWRLHQRRSPHPRLAATEAALVAAATGGWTAAAVTSGPLGWPARLLTVIYLAGAIGGYRWLRRHEAVRAARGRRDEAAAWIARKAAWHLTAYLIGLGDFHLQSVTKTRLGEELLLTSAPGSELATRVAANSRPFAEKYAHLHGLPYGRVDIRLTDYPGQLVIEVREEDPSVSGPVTHPALDQDSPYAGWFPERRSIRQPIPVGVIPETGEPMTLTLWDEEGGKAVGVYSMTGGGKTNVLDDIREWVTACDDAVLVQLNGAGSGDERTWEPLAAVTAAGLQADDPGLRQRILGALQWVRHLIGERSETAADTGESVFQPTRQDPAVVVMIDEIDETGNIEGASKVLEFLASKQRKAAVCLILAGQRATATWTGGAGVRINLSTMLIGVLARDSETRHAVGAENEIPDISAYSHGEAGYFGVWSVRQKKYVQRGRTFWIGKIGMQKDKIIARRDPAARPVLKGVGEIPGTAPAAPGRQIAGGLRERLAKVQELNGERPLAEGPLPGGTLPLLPGVPPEIVAGLVRVLASGALPASAAGLALGMSKSAAHRYLAALREAGVVETTGTGRAIKWRLVRAGPAAAQAQPYTTIEALAQAVHDGLVDATDEQREVLEQTWQIARRPRLTVLQGGGGSGQ
jgi:DNA-binding transcriptional ArsR family regulator